MDTKKIKEEIIGKLKEVYDPEIPVNVWDLGFICSIDVNEDGNAHILMTLTVPGCPIYQVIMKSIEDKVKELESLNEVNVELTFNPRWSMDKISEDGLKRLRELGYKV